MYCWIILLYTWNWNNVVNQLYSNIKQKVNKNTRPVDPIASPHLPQDDWLMDSKNGLKSRGPAPQALILYLPPHLHSFFPQVLTQEWAVWLSPPHYRSQLHWASAWLFLCFFEFLPLRGRGSHTTSETGTFGSYFTDSPYRLHLVECR